MTAATARRHERASRQPYGSRALVVVPERNDVLVDDISQRAHAAIIAGDWSALYLLLHPYLHWTDDSGRTFRGRNKVLAMLKQADQLPASAQSIELRDGQIYRWHA